MHDFVADPSAPPLVRGETTPLFMCRGAGIVLIGTHENGRWVLARAWLEGDRLEHVRRWSFPRPIPFSGQVRRLIIDATGDSVTARDEGFRALAWTEALS